MKVRPSLIATLAWVLGCTVCTTSFAQSMAYYKWKDASGAMHYSATPPPHAKAEVLHVRASSTVSDIPAPASSAPVANPLGQAEATYRRQSCAAAKNDVEILGKGTLVVAGSDPSTATRMDSTQRDAALLKAKARISQFCGGE